MLFFNFVCQVEPRDWAKLEPESSMENGDRKVSQTVTNKKMISKNSIFLISVVLASVTVEVEASDSLTLTKAPSNEKNRDFTWRQQAIQKLWEERKAMGHTPLRKFPIPGMPDVDLIFKDESVTKIGSLKFRFGWALFMWALLEGHIDQNTTVYEASSGNTAICESYMTKLIGVPFVAVVPDYTEDTKVNHIKEYGGKVLKADIAARFGKAALEAEKNHGFYMNQFANAHRAEEFHESGNGELESVNVMHEIVQQLKSQNLKEPDFFIHAAGTGGTISSVGRYVQKYNLDTKVIMADPEFSIYYDYVINGKFMNESGASLWKTPGMAGIGFGYAGPAILGQTSSLQPSVVNGAFKLPDIASTASMHVLREYGISGGTSTGMNFLASLSLAAKERSKKSQGPLRIVTLLGDPGTVYESSYYNISWIKQKFDFHGGLPVFDCWKDVIRNSFTKGSDPLAVGSELCSKEAVKDSASRRSKRETNFSAKFRSVL
ncbi:hypothetical protein FO519_009864 [Halicephalobus sp. NKZ332]|nr:hypothetical protein FO519_009864 [Halicephalobus sp. NKZ332]